MSVLIGLEPYGAEPITVHYNCCFLKKRSKAPDLPDWPNNPRQFSEWREGIGIGIITGDITGKGVFALDVDTPDEELSTIMAQMLVSYLSHKGGKKLFRYGDGKKFLMPFRLKKDFNSSKISKDQTDSLYPNGDKTKGKRYKQQIEILGDDHQFCAYQIHPDTGQPYEWIDGETSECEQLYFYKPEDLVELSRTELSVIKKEFLQTANKLGFFKPEKVEKKSSTSTAVTTASYNDDEIECSDIKRSPEERASIGEATEILSYIDSDCGYDEWLAVAMALHNEYSGSDEGYQLFDEWSSKGSKYPGKVETRRKWDSLDSDKATTMASACMLARDAGADLSAISRKHRQHPQVDPIPLPDDLLPVEPFDYALLPAAVRPWVEDVCERLQCPSDFVAVAVMTALGSLIGRKVGIRPQSQTDWTVVANMWALVVGRPGVMKTPALEQARAPVKRLEAEAKDRYQTEMELYESIRDAAKLRKETAAGDAKKLLRKNRDADITSLLQVEEPEEPILKRYSANDTTPASLGELLRQNQNGLLIYRDEMVSLLKSLDREDQAEGRGFYLTGWNGDSSYTFDRIGRGFNLYIEAVCISLLGGTQPGKLAEYVYHATQGGNSDDGLLQRFGLIVWPDVDREWQNVDRWPDKESKNQAFEVFDRLAELNPSDIGADQDTDYSDNPDGIPYLRFSPDALELFVEWRTALEHRLRSDDLHSALESHFAKYRKLIPGLALIIHLADGGTGSVSAQSTLQSLAWSDYLESHARRVYGSVTNRCASTAKEILKRITKGDLTTPFSSRDVWRPGWSKLSDRKAVQQALEMLVDYQWLFEEIRDTGGRPATMYHLNQKAAA